MTINEIKKCVYSNDIINDINSCISKLNNNNERGYKAIFDIDNTIVSLDFSNSDVNINENLDPHERTTSQEPIYETIDLLHNLQKRNIDIIFITGRNEKSRVETEKFLSEQNITNYKLLMNNTIDDLPTDKIKENLLSLIANDIPKIIFSIDDDQKNISMYKKNGIYTVDAKKRR